MKFIRKQSSIQVSGFTMGKFTPYVGLIVKFQGLRPGAQMLRSGIGNLLRFKLFEL